MKAPFAIAKTDAIRAATPLRRYAATLLECSLRVRALDIGPQIERLRLFPAFGGCATLVFVVYTRISRMRGHHDRRAQPDFPKR